jgi:protein SCO1
MRNVVQQFIMLAMLLTGTHAVAQTDTVVPDRYEPVPPRFKRDTQNVGITEHLGAKIPLGLTFTDSTGQQITLDSIFKRNRPVILQLGYFDCPMICDVVSKEIMESVKDLTLELGKDYDIIYLSVNPRERWELGQEKKRNYIEIYNKPGAAEGWHFLVGQENNIQQLADAVGFGFRKVEGKEEWSHPPMIVVLTGTGQISRYFYGNRYPSDQVRISLVEAGDGKVGSYVEQVLVALCYHFDGYSGKYSFAYMNLMRMAGISTVFIVLIVLGRLWIRDAFKPQVAV